MRTQCFVPLLLLILTACIFGCIAKEPSHVLTSATLNDNLIERAFHAHRNGETMRAIARIAIDSNESSVSRRFAVAVARPSRLRIESLPLFGPPDFLLSFCDGTFKAYVPEASKFYVGKATGKNLLAFFKINLSPAAITSLMTGAPPLSPHVATRLSGYHDGKGRLRIDLLEGEKVLQSLWLNADLHMSELEINEGAGITPLKAFFSDYQAAAPQHPAYPQKITVIVEEPETVTIDIRYRDVAVSYDDSASFFDLQVPPLLSPIYIDRGNR